MKNIFKEAARRILKDEKEIVEHELGDACDKLTEVLNNKKATKADMTEAMKEAICHINEARGML